MLTPLKVRGSLIMLLAASVALVYLTDSLSSHTISTACLKSMKMLLRIYFFRSTFLIVVEQRRLDLGLLNLVPLL